MSVHHQEAGEFKNGVLASGKDLLAVLFHGGRGKKMTVREGAELVFLKGTHMPNNKLSASIIVLIH